jgi:hypothetical protein
MGLDMYLQRRKNMLQQDFSDAHDDKLSGVIYWRKANAIHKYFVDYGKLAHDGAPDVGYYYIDRQDLIHLIERIISILNGPEITETITYHKIAEDMNEVREDVKYNLNIELAKELLPTTSGFFFGGTDYNHWYHEDLVRTLDILKRELAATPENETWYYYASW